MMPTIIIPKSKLNEEDHVLWRYNLVLMETVFKENQLIADTLADKKLQIRQITKKNKEIKNQKN
jgi:hypothetical protein